jgi:hypothetical protein
MSSLLVFNRVYRLYLHSVMLVFSTQLFWTIAPLAFSLVHLPHPSPPQKVCGWEEGGRVLSQVGDHILQEFNILFNQIQTYKIAFPPQTKT